MFSPQGRPSPTGGPENLDQVVSSAGYQVHEPNPKGVSETSPEICHGGFRRRGYFFASGRFLATLHAKAGPDPPMLRRSGGLIRPLDRSPGSKTLPELRHVIRA